MYSPGLFAHFFVFSVSFFSHQKQSGVFRHSVCKAPPFRVMYLNVRVQVWVQRPDSEGHVSKNNKLDESLFSDLVWFWFYTVFFNWTSSAYLCFFKPLIHQNHQNQAVIFVFLTLILFKMYLQIFLQNFSIWIILQQTGSIANFFCYF